MHWLFMDSLPISCLIQSCRQISSQNASTRLWVDAWPKCAMMSAHRLGRQDWHSAHGIQGIFSGIHKAFAVLYTCFSNWICGSQLTWKWWQVLVVQKMEWKRMWRKQCNFYWKNTARFMQKWKKNIHIAQQKQMETYHRKHLPKELPVGTEVLVKNTAQLQR